MFRKKLYIKKHNDKLPDFIKTEKGDLIDLYISDIVSVNGNSNIHWETNNDKEIFNIRKGDKILIDFGVSIKLPKGEYTVKGEVPFNMSTLKSQIRNGRIILQGMVEREFEELNHMYLY
jgi:hypothetical protein